MSKNETRLRDASGVESIIDDLVAMIADSAHASAKLRLVGIRTRGVVLAHRIADKLNHKLNKPVPVGAVDITLYRDDLDDKPRWPVLHGTEIPFMVDDADVVLVDDVLYTGRTVRAAMNAICDLGRPARIRLAVAVDRGPRELPIAAEMSGLDIGETPHRPVHVRLKEIDGVDEIVQVGKAKSESVAEDV